MGSSPSRTATGVRVRVPAKINLALKVGAPRADGYHPLATVYQAVSVYDEVHA
ncbi:MAG: 4-(cytidine 5'-diphospho)-2-C-methyl-D-erythritol kinase, partial [Propionibacteriaceae bacterium]